MTTPFAPQAAQFTAIVNDGAVRPGAVQEHSFSNYLGEMHRTLTTSPMGGHLANPGHLAGQVTGVLRGFLKRAGDMEPLTSEQSPQKSKKSPVKITSLSNEGVELHRGPAFASFETGGETTAVEATAQTERDERRRAQLEELFQAMDNTVQAQRFLAETMMVSGGTSSLDKSVNTLLRGQ